MKITEVDEPLKTFEPLPTTHELYLSAIRYGNSTQWLGGPSDRNKKQLIDMLGNYNGIAEARIYTVVLPINKVEG